MDAAEQFRNDHVYELYQHNRNPFVDHPEWVNLTFAPPHTNAPVLHIAQVSSGTKLYWLATNQSARLEYTTNLAVPWSDWPATPVLTNRMFELLLLNTESLQFFQLRTW